MWVFGRFVGRFFRRGCLFVPVLLVAAHAYATPLSPLLPAPHSLPLTDKRLLGFQQQVERFSASGQYDSALAPAQALADALAEDLRLGVQALENLALVQVQGGDLVSGTANLQAVVDRLQQSTNFRDPRLARPLFALGLAYYRADDFPQAIEHLERAIFITRTDKGLESLEQTTHDALLLDSLLKSGRVEDALDRLAVSLTIQRQALQSGPELEQALARAANWYRTLGAPYQESHLHEERLEILARELGAESPELVPLYYDLAGSYSRRMRDDLEKLQDIKAAERNVSYSFVRTDQIRRAIAYDLNGGRDDRDLLDAEWKAVRALKLALNILLAQPEPNQRAIADTYVRLGDHYQLIGDSRKARRYYQRAYDGLNASGLTELLTQTFGAPVPIYHNPLKLPRTEDPEVLRAYRGEAELVLDVNSRGEPRNIELLEVRPRQAALLEDKALRYSRDTIFRPRFTEEGTVATERLRYIYRFLPQSATQ